MGVEHGMRCLERLYFDWHARLNDPPLGSPYPALRCATPAIGRAFDALTRSADSYRLVYAPTDTKL
jgi:hypothetical protein